MGCCLEEVALDELVLQKQGHRLGVIEEAVAFPRREIVLTEAGQPFDHGRPEGAVGVGSQVLVGDRGVQAGEGGAVVGARQHAAELRADDIPGQLAPVADDCGLISGQRLSGERGRLEIEAPRGENGYELAHGMTGERLSLGFHRLVAHGLCVPSRPTSHCGQTPTLL